MFIRTLHSKVFLLFLCSSALFASEPQFFAEGDLLYWKAQEGGLAYAMEVKGQKERLKTPSFEWDFGFKLAVGALLPTKNWAFLLRLTHFNTHADAFPKGALFPLWVTPIEPKSLAAEMIKMHWRLHLALIDALAEKSYPLTANLSLSPQMGLRYALVRQKFNLDYFGRDFSPAFEEFLTMKNKFWGLGPLVGLRIEVPFATSWCLGASGAFSALYGQFYIHEGEYRFLGRVKRASLHDTYTRVAFTGESGLFLRWQRKWERWSLALHLGYDFLWLWRQNRFVPLDDKADLNSSGSLRLQGLEAGALFTF